MNAAVRAESYDPGRPKETTVTPCAGYITVGHSAIVGIASGLVCYAAVQLKSRLKWDDALDVWGVHGVGGMLGIVLLGVFASTATNPAGGVGLIHGHAGFATRRSHLRLQATKRNSAAFWCC